MIFNDTTREVVLAAEVFDHAALPRLWSVWAFTATCSTTCR